MQSYNMVRFSHKNNLVRFRHKNDLGRFREEIVAWPKITTLTNSLKQEIKWSVTFTMATRYGLITTLISGNHLLAYW